MSQEEARSKIDYAPAKEPAPTGGGGKKRAMWAMGDQGIVSLGNMVTVFLLGRGLETSAFGRFNVILETIFFLNSLQAALIVYPLSVRGAAVNIKRLQRFTGASLIITLAMGLMMGLGMALAGGLTHRILPWLLAIVAMILWQVQETTRRGLMAHLRFRDAIWGDSISYLGQAALLAAFVFLPRLGGRAPAAGAASRATLSLEYVFIVMAVTSAAGAIVQFSQIGFRSVTRRTVWRFGTRAWQLGRWIVLASFVGIATGYGYTLLLAATHGEREVALFAALGGLMKFANPLMVGIQGLLLPACAQANSRGGVRAAIRVAFRYGAAGAVMLLPFFLALSLFPEKITWLIYKNPDYQNHAMAIRIFVLGYAMVYAGNVMMSLLNALEQSKSSFVAQTVCTVTAVLVSLPMTYVMGAIGAIVGGMITNVARLGALLEMLRRALRNSGRETLPPTSPAGSPVPTSGGPHAADAVLAAQGLAADSGVTVGAA